MTKASASFLQYSTALSSCCHLAVRKAAGQAPPEPAAWQAGPPHGPAVPLEHHHRPQQNGTSSAPLPARHGEYLSRGPSLVFGSGGKGQGSRGQRGRAGSGRGHGLLNPSKSERPWEVEATGDGRLAELHIDPRQSSQRNDVLFGRLLERWSAFLLTN